MLSPYIPDYSGAIDPRRVRFALLRQYLIFFWVIAVNFLINTAALFFVLHDIRAALFVLAAYLCGGLLITVLIDMQKRKVAIVELPECGEPYTSIYRDIVGLWEACCRSSGYRSGGVYVVYPLHDSEFGNIQSFGVLRTLCSRAPILFIAAPMFDKFSRKELCAAILHESGHLRTMPMHIRHLTDIVALPMSMVLRIIAQLRMFFPDRFILARILYRLERCLHFVSMFFVNHSDEYCADAYAVKMQNTAEHLINVLMKLDAYHHAHCEADMIIVEMSFALDRESHQHTHPTTQERISRLDRLRKNYSYHKK